MKSLFNLLSLFLLAVVFTFSSCDKDPTEDLEEIIKEDLGYVPKIAAFRLVTPASTAVPPGTNLTMDLRYWSEGQIKDIQFFMIRGTQETKIGESPYTPAYSKVTRTDSLLFTYQVPTTIARGSTFTIQARVTNQGLEQYPARATLSFTVPQ
ncbi:hypothetical protein ACD591_13445 [Rufibacter glacialis]|uniref:DUF3872 domain-containing protein n=1 Tax=Rufibacter glacialis TaxID=1259555 RepID=A0A5M8Q7S8_9BACT|nr:hypothetical protein [Rufibacter glacialis]KAA6431141.1 hypothetical protein FOE74_18780 [Rufibacter glacialis]GGK84339.1 hypothetical protein GCM10011405_35350 [Rufibacter glacialis]